MQSFPILETPELRLRQIVEDDLENIFNGLSHPDVIRHYGVSFQTLEETRRQMKWYADLEQQGTGIWWAICDRQNGIFYGAAGLNNISMTHRKGEIGFWLLPDYWQRGVMTAALPLICHHAFNTLGLHRIEAQVESNNTASRKLLQRLGFHHEGTLRDYEVKNGQYISLDIFAIFMDQF